MAAPTVFFLDTRLEHPKKLASILVSELTSSKKICASKKYSNT